MTIAEKVSALMAKWFGPNWIMIVTSVAAFLLDIPSVTSAVFAVIAGTPVDWHAMRSSVATSLLAVGLAWAKAHNNHSTQAQVAVATEKAESAPATTVQPPPVPKP